MSAAGGAMGDPGRRIYPACLQQGQDVTEITAGGIATRQNGHFPTMEIRVVKVSHLPGKGRRKSICLQAQRS